MDAQLQAIKEAQEGGDHDTARELATEFVSANPHLYTDDVYSDAHSTKNIEKIVGLVDVFRAAEMLDAQWQVEAWIYHYVPPQDIGGTYHPQLRSNV